MAKTSAAIFGVILVVAGIWGLFSESAIGFIAADYVSSIIHIVLGLVLLVVAAKPSAAAALKTIGIIYVILGILGLIGAAFIANDTTTAVFYLIVGIVVAICGFSAKSGSVAPQM
jgi:uncharacterized membrane protein